MQVGLLFSHRNPPAFAVPWPRLYGETLEQVEAAEALGFDAVFTTEHHFSEDGYSPSVLPIMASWAARTSSIGIGSYVMLLPLQHPLRTAEDAATVDIISGGRLTLGLGLGYRAEEFAGLGVSRRHAGEVMDEALEVLVRAWSGERFSFEGKHFQYSGVQLAPRPVQEPRPPIWVGSPNQRSVLRVARWGLEGFAGAPGPELYATYLAACERFGTAPHAQSQVLLFGHLHEDGEQAWAEAEPYAAYLHESYRAWARAAGNERSFRGTPRDDLMIGGVAHWRARIESAIAACGTPPTQVIVQLQLPGMPHELVMRSMALFARELLPGLQARA